MEFIDSALGPTLDLLAEADRELEMTPRDALTYLERVVEDRADIDPGIPVAIGVLSELANREQSLKDAYRLVRPAMSSLMTEVGNRGATGWGLVNEALCRVERLLAGAKRSGDANDQA